MKLRNGVKYVALSVSAFAVLEFVATKAISRGYEVPFKHPFENAWIVDYDALSGREWYELEKRHLINLALTWLFVVSGPTTALPSDFNTASNQINLIGSGVGGAPGSGGNSTTTGIGGNGGAGGAFTQITNYSGHSAGQTVNVTVGGGDTIWDSSAVGLAKAASGTTGGQASACVPSGPAQSGGNAGLCTGLSNFSGAGGGGAGGPHGAGNNGANGSTNGLAVSGGAGDAGNTAAGANGQQFGPNASSQLVGPGGGGGGGAGGGFSQNGNPGGNAGAYGAGGGGGGGGGETCAMGFCSTTGGNGGTGFQGLIAYSYTPAVAAGARSYAFIIG